MEGIQNLKGLENLNLNLEYNELDENSDQVLLFDQNMKKISKNINI